MMTSLSIILTICCNPVRQKRWRMAMNPACIGCTLYSMHPLYSWEWSSQQGRKNRVKKKGNAMVRVGRKVSFPMLHIADAYDRASSDRSSALMARLTAGAKCNRSISLKHNGSISR